jgi:hypothetical protein
MTTRWVVDVDGRGLCAVAAESNGRSQLVAGPASREKCERLLVGLRAGDADRVARQRRRSGLRLAAANERQRNEPSPGQG